MATLTAKILADFTTSLASAMAVGATTGTLQSATDDDGVALPTGTYYFTLDGSNSGKEHIRCTLTGTALTSIYSISRQGVATSGTARAHRLGATVTLTDFAHIKVINDLVNGTTALDATAPLKYDSDPSITLDAQIATKKYIDNVAIAGGADASSTVKGISKLSVDPVSPTNPIAVGDNDTRVPTQGENDALAGTGGIVGSSNPYVTLNTLTGIISPYAGSSAPTGWLLCDGSAVSRTTYADLFAITSTTFGIGDNSTTFNLPDLRSRSPVGVGAGTKVATFASRASNVITVTGLSNTSTNEFQTGQAVVYHYQTTAITGLVQDTTYYIIRTGNLTFSLATTRANAVIGTAISLSSDGSGTQTFTLTLINNTYGSTGGEENHTLLQTELPSSSAIVGSSDTRNVSSPDSNLATTAVGSTSHNNRPPFLALNYIIKT